MIRFQFPQRHPMARVAYTPDSLAVVTAQPHTGVFVRDRFSGATIREFPIPNVAEYDELAVSPCGRFLGIRHAKGFEIFSLQSSGGERVHRSWGVTAFSLANGTIRVINRLVDANHVMEWVLPLAAGVTGPEARPPVDITSGGTVIAMSPDGRGAVAVRQRGKPQLVELTTGQTVAELNFTLRRTPAGITGFAVFSPNVGAVALGNGEKIAVFDLSEFDWTTVREKPRQLHPVCELDRPDPAAGGTVKDRKAEHWLPPLAFTPDGRHFLTLGLRERVQLFDAKSGGVAEQWGWRMEDVTCLAVAPDGLTACAGGRRGRLTVWDLC